MNDITGVRRYAMNLVSILLSRFRSFDYFTFHWQRFMDKKVRCETLCLYQILLQIEKTKPTKPTKLFHLVGFSKPTKMRFDWNRKNIHTISIIESNQLAFLRGNAKNVKVIMFI